MVIHPAIKLRHIRTFMDIAAKGSLSDVARAQGMTQPALSRTLSELETLLGQPLFLREKRRLVLTEAGIAFRSHANLGLQELDAAAAALTAGAAAGAIRVGVLPSAATSFFPRVALQFGKSAPEMLLKVETGPHFYLTGLLRRGEIDLMIGRLPAGDDMAGLIFEHLYEDDIVLVCRAGHPQAGLAASAVLPDAALILPPEGAVIRRAVDDYLASLGLRGLRPRLETVALAVGRGIVLRSDAVWFISRGVVQEELSRGDLVEIPTHVRFLSGAVGATLRQAGPAVAGRDLLISLCRQMADEVRKSRL